MKEETILEDFLRFSLPGALIVFGFILGSIILNTRESNITQISKKGVQYYLFF